MLIFQMTPAVAVEFYERCKERGAETEKERQEILIEFVKEHKIQSVSETSRTREQYVKDMSKEFDILDLGHIEPEE